MKELYKKLINSKEYKEWKKKNKDSFLCTYLVIEHTQFDFYNKNDTITSFTMGDKIDIKEDEKFLKSKQKLKELKLNEIKVTQEQALNLIKERKDYDRKIIILQNTKEPFWNITLINPVKILNIKINAINKKIIDKIEEPISKLMKKVM